MFAQVHHPQVLDPEVLDHYLSQGWFRMGQTIFTTNFLTFNEHLYGAIWLRVSLKEFKPTKTQSKLLKSNIAFNIKISEASITPEKEILFDRYKQCISFEASPSLHNLFYGKSFHNIYNTHEVTVCDGDNLIAVGYFDVGATSAAGIASFYDPAYKKYSLGNYMMFLKMDYCSKMGLQYFYPGYFVPGYSFFDYKLKINNSVLQYLEFHSQQWKAIGSFHPAVCPLNVMQDKLHTLQINMAEAKVASKILKYVFYDANLFPDFIEAELFDFPLFLYCFEMIDDQIHPIIIYDASVSKYRLVRCKQVWKSNLPNRADETYSSYLLKIEEDLFSTESSEEMVTTLLRLKHAYITLR